MKRIKDLDFPQTKQASGIGLKVKKTLDRNNLAIQCHLKFNPKDTNFHSAFTPNNEVVENEKYD